MNEMLLQEYVDRRGLVTPAELSEQTGAAPGLWRQPAIRLIENRDIYYCRLEHGRETLVSKHLLFCLRAVYSEPELTVDEQALYDWLSDNGLVWQAHMMEKSGLKPETFEAAFLELQRKMCIAPLGIRGEAEAPLDEIEANGFLTGLDFLWVTDEYWLEGIRRPAKYKDLEYCISEMRRLLKKYFSSREINSLIYHGTL